MYLFKLSDACVYLCACMCVCVSALHACVFCGMHSRDRYLGATPLMKLVQTLCLHNLRIYISNYKVIKFPQ